MERLTERKRNNDGSGISTKSLVFENGMQKGFPSGHCGRIVTKLAEYEDLEEQGLMMKLPCDRVYCIVDKNTKYATVMPRSITDLRLYEIEGIDKKGYYWSTKEKGEEALRKMKGGK